MKVSIIGTGYVGLSLATLLAQHNDVVAVDIVPEKVDLINNKTLIANFKELEINLPTGDDLKGQTEVNFPLSSLVPMVYGIEAKKPQQADSDHKFTLKLTDEAGQELSQTLVFHYTAKADSE